MTEETDDKAGHVTGSSCMQSTFSLAECSRIPALTGPPFQWEADHKQVGKQNKRHRRAQMVQSRKPRARLGGWAALATLKDQGAKNWAFLSVAGSAQSCSEELWGSLGIP